MSLFLILIGIVLIVFNIRFIKDKDKENKISVVKAKPEEINSFSGVLKREELDITAVDIRIGELRVEFSETILELQKEIVELNNKIESLLEAGLQDKISNVIPLNEGEDRLEITNKEFEPGNRMEEIGELLRKGFSVEEISEKFQIGRGEILLIEKLYRK